MLFGDRVARILRKLSAIFSGFHAIISHPVIISHLLYIPNSSEWYSPQISGLAPGSMLRPCWDEEKPARISLSTPRTDCGDDLVRRGFSSTLSGHQIRRPEAASSIQRRARMRQSRRHHPSCAPGDSRLLCPTCSSWALGEVPFLAARFATVCAAG